MLLRTQSRAVCLVAAALAFACNQTPTQGGSSGGGGGGGGTKEGSSAAVKLPSPPPGARLFGQRRFATAFQVTGLCAGDFDGDGDLDVAATGQDGEVWIHANDGAGELLAKRKVRFTIATSAPVSGDFDLDGDDDLVVLQPSKDRALVLRSKGNGGSKAVGLVNTVSAPRVALLEDLTGDGLPDLVVGGALDVAVHVNLGKSAFGPAVSTTLATSPIANVLLADVAGDATPELLLTDQNRLEVWASQPDGSFTPLVFTLGSWGGPLALADVNGDGALDALTGACDQGVGLYLGQGDGSFVAWGLEPLAGCRTGTAGGDLDGDGFDEVIVVHGTDVSLLRGSPGGLGPAVAHPAGLARGLVVADFDGDGRDDVVTGNWTFSELILLRGLGDGTLDAPPYFDLGSDPVVSLGDLDGDALLDIIAPPRNLVAGLGGGAFEAPALLPFPFAGRATFVDLNLDQVTDLVCNSATVYLGDGMGSIGPPTPYLTGPTSRPLSADLNGDFLPDLVATVPAADELDVLFGNGDGTFAPAVTYPTGSYPGVVSLADLDRDGLLDAVTCNRNGDDLTIYYGAADGSFHSPQAIAAGQTPVDLAVGDFDGDLDLDLVVATLGQSPIPASLDLHVNRGDGTFEDRRQIAALAADQVRAADFDQDGRLDLAVAAGNVRLFLGRGNGKFHAPASFNVGQATVKSLEFGDLTGDGWLDLVAGNQDQKATVLINQGAP